VWVAAKDKVIRGLLERPAQAGVDGKLRERQVIVPVLVSALEKTFQNADERTVGALDQAISLRMRSGCESPANAKVVTNRLEVMAYKFRALIGDELLGCTITCNKITCKPASDGTSVFKREGANFDEAGKKVDSNNGILVPSAKCFR